MGRSLTGTVVVALSAWPAVSVTVASSRSAALPPASGGPTKLSGSRLQMRAIRLLLTRLHCWLTLSLPM